MQLTPNTYYDHSLYSDSFTLMRMAIMDYFGKNVFRSDLSRVIYASADYAFRQRLNLLSKNGISNVKELDLPFMRFYRQGNWQVDTTKPAVLNARGALEGFEDETIGFQNIRFLQTKIQFDCTMFFTRDDDAQLAYESLMWIQQPSMKQFLYGSLDYKGYSIQPPIQLQLENLQWMPQYTESEWLQKAHIIPIDFTLSLRSFVMSQLPQSPDSSIFWNDSKPVITEKVKLEFLSAYYRTSEVPMKSSELFEDNTVDNYKAYYQYYDALQAGLEVDAILSADPTLNGIIQINDVQKNQFTINWTYNEDITDNYETDVVININGAVNYTVAMNLKTYTVTGLSPESPYKVNVWFTSKTGEITKYSATTTTLQDTTAILKVQGIIGYT